MDVDFKAPSGAPALFPSDGISWTIFSNPVALFIGGVSAVLLELAEPAVRSGVWDHSSFRRDPGMRLRRTGFAAMVTVYAPAEQARALIGRVVAMHERVNGVTPDGQPYRANDPRLLDWVQATASFGFIEAYHRYVRTLTPAEKDAALTEGAAASRLYGAVGAPRSWQEWDDLLASTAPGWKAPTCCPNSSRS
ncbi:oxygenase MpaB family protein [Novosphingobium panipatense]|uniref:oxygenase MpaB family protein n=1 Tax=Novosphingobium panipatense TaxID=428991 RepID=UPI0036079A4A